MPDEIELSLLQAGLEDGTVWQAEDAEVGKVVALYIAAGLLHSPS